MPFLFACATSQFTTEEQHQRVLDYFVTVNISHLAEMTTPCRNMVNTFSTALLRTRGEEVLGRYWLELMNCHYWDIGSFFPWAARFGKLEFLFDCCRRYLQSDFGQRQTSIEITRWCYELCKACVQRQDYLSVIIIIAQLLKSFGVFPVDLDQGVSIEALHDLLSTSYIMMSLQARAMQFKNY